MERLFSIGFLGKNYYNLLLFVFICALTSCKQISNTSEDSSVQLPEDQQRQAVNARKGLEIYKGLAVTLFASEPMITNPTNIDIDSRGRVWVCEAYNYRPELNPGDPVKEEGDKILILEDLDGDGVADTAKVFYQGNDVNAALGIAVLGDKVIVSCSPKVLVFTDTDGDDKPDKKEILFEAIGGEQHDHGVHAFTFGPDGKLYFNFGNMGDSLVDKNGNIVKDKYGVPVNNQGKPFRQGMAFRCNPDGSELEVLGHNFRNPYEIAVDSYGNLWQSDNDDDGNRSVRINYLLRHGNYGYTDEMTGDNWRAPRVNMEDSIPFRHWHLNDPGVVPNLLQTGAGAPTGILIYEGQLLPEIFRGQMIHAEALRNVVRSYPVTKDGAGYRAEVVNILEGVYDKWFRPSDVTVAPDGSLFVSDWYDPGVGGHQVADLSQGRIFRIAPRGKKYVSRKMEMETPAQAAKALESPNLATRYLAWEKLNNQGIEAIPVLEKMSKSSNPVFAARALWLLGKIPGKELGYIMAALKNGNEDIRKAAVRAAVELNQDITPVLKTAMDDASPQVRSEVAIALYKDKSPSAREIWSNLAQKYDGQDRWYLEALGIGANGQWDSFFEYWIDNSGEKSNSPEGKDIIWRARTARALPYLEKILKDPATDVQHKLKFFRALDFYKDSSKQRILLSVLDDDSQTPDRALLNAIVFTQVDPGLLSNKSHYRSLLDPSLEAVKGRSEYLTLVDKFHIRGKEQDLFGMALEGKSADLRSGATGLIIKDIGKPAILNYIKTGGNNGKTLIDNLGQIKSGAGDELLSTLVTDAGLSQELKLLAIKSLADGWGGRSRLLRLLEEKRIDGAQKDIVARELLKDARKEVREKAMAFLNIDGSQKSNIAPVSELTSLTGDAVKGKNVFKAYCTSCHRVDGDGEDFGPDLSEIGGKLAKEALYKAIMDPDAGISFGFEGYTFKLKNGKRVLGYVSNETSTEVDVKTIGGKVEKISKADVVSKTPYEHSLMPTGLAEAMGQQDLISLVEYMNTLKRVN